VLRDLSHEIDYALWLFEAPRQLTAMIATSSRLGIEAEEAADLLWCTESGAIVTLRLDYLTRRSRRSMLAQGSRGEIEWDAVAGTVRIAAEGNDELFHIAHDRDAMMQSQAQAFLDAAGGASSGALCTFDEGVRVVRACDAARRSSRIGQATPLEAELT
jgi:predicted dehydrogenase